MKLKTPKRQLRMPLLGKGTISNQFLDMMITGKIIEKAEEEEEDSDEQPPKDNEDDYEEDFDFEQYSNINEECSEVKKAYHPSHLHVSMKEKAMNKKEMCETCSMLIPSNKLEKHMEECNLPQSQKFVLDVKSIKFSERAQKKKLPKQVSSEYSDSFEGRLSLSLYSIK